MIQDQLSASRFERGEIGIDGINNRADFLIDNLQIAIEIEDAPIPVRIVVSDLERTERNSRAAPGRRAMAFQPVSLPGCFPGNTISPSLFSRGRTCASRLRVAGRSGNFRASPALHRSWTDRTCSVRGSLSSPSLTLSFESQAAEDGFVQLLALCRRNCAAGSFRTGIDDTEIPGVKMRLIVRGGARQRWRRSRPDSVALPSGPGVRRSNSHSSRRDLMGDHRRWS